DEVITCSSSVGLQALVWGRRLVTKGDTFLAPYSSSNAAAANREWQNTCHNTLSFALARNQPLASATLTNKQFIVSLIEEMLGRKRSGRKGLDLLPRFKSIDPTYDEQLASSFTTQRALKELGGKNHNWDARQNELKKFRKAMNDPEIKVLSFDVFDTL